MHPCLQINEILTNMFESTRVLEAVEQPQFPLWPAKGSKNLATLARTCKAFSEPALDLLWEFQPSLAPLIECLPKDAIAVNLRVTKFSIGNDMLDITRDLFPEDWERVNYYARRIRAIGCPERRFYGYHILSRNALAVIRSRGPGSNPITPNLLHFSACLSHFLDTPLYPSLVVGLHLKTLGVFASDDHQRQHIDNELLATNLESVFGPTSSSISSCSLLLPTGNTWGVFPSPILTRLYCGFTFMQKFDLQEAHISYEALVTLSALPYLRSLKMVISGTQLEKFNLVIKSDAIFSSLEELWIRTDVLVHVQEFFHHPGIGTLHTFQVTEAYNYVNNWAVDSFVNVFQGQQSSSQLRHFGIFEQPYWGQSSPSHSTITNHTLMPLLLYANMTTLTMDLSVVTIDNDMLKKMADAWPHLQILDLNDRSTGTIPQATLLGLIPLIACCRDLTRLTIRINALGDVQTALSQMGKLIPGKALKLLGICTSPVDDVDAVASVIKRLFPRLKAVIRGWTYWDLGSVTVEDEPVGLEGEYYRHWGEIERIIDARARRLGIS